MRLATGKYRTTISTFHHAAFALMSVSRYIAGLVAVILILATLVVPSSCTSFNSKPDAYYDSLYKGLLDRYRLGKQDSTQHWQDSLFKATTNPGGYYRYKHHEFSARYYYHMIKLDTSKMYVDSMINTLESYGLTHKYPLEYSRELNAKGNYYFYGNILDSAFDCYSRSNIAAHESTAPPCWIWDITYHLGMIAYRQEKYETATANFKQAFTETNICATDSGIYFKQQELLNNIALSYTHLDKYDSAKKYYLNALLLINTEGKKYAFSSRISNMSLMATGVVYGNLAKVYIALKMTDTAEQLLLKSIEINSRPDADNRDALFTRMQLAELYYNEGKFTLAKTMLDAVMESMKREPEPSIDLRWRYLMYKYHKTTQQRDLSFQYLEQYMSLKDSLSAVDKKLKKTDYAQLLKDQETQYQLNLLKKDNQVSQLYLFITVTLSAISLLIIISVYVNYRKSRKNVEMLTTLNAQINDQKNKLEQTRDALQISNQGKTRILQVVAHDLRSPISGIVMLTNLIAEDEEDKAKKESLKLISKASQTLFALTGELLEFSENDHEETSQAKEVVDMNDITSQVTGLLQFKAAEKQQRLQVDMPGDAVYVLANKEKISRVISNLVANAIKFSGVDSVIEVSLLEQKDKLLIKVKDNGIGIPENLLPFVFDSFTHAKRYGTEGEKSFGLGLSICRQIVEEHDGRIWIESEEGKGSTFFVELPLTDAPASI